MSPICNLSARELRDRAAEAEAARLEAIRTGGEKTAAVHARVRDLYLERAKSMDKMEGKRHGVS